MIQILCETSADEAPCQALYLMADCQLASCVCGAMATCQPPGCICCFILLLLRFCHCHLLPAAIGFPVGFSTHGTPVGMQLFGPPGWDSRVLNLALQMQKLFGEMPPPPNPSLCAGCSSVVSAIPVPWPRQLWPPFHAACAYNEGHGGH